MDLSKLVDGLKLPPRYVFATALVSGLLLFSGSRFLAAVGLTDFVESYRPWIGVLFLISVALWISHGMAPVAQRTAKRIREWNMLRKKAKYFHELTPREQEILRGYIENNTRTQNLSLMDGSVQGLVAQKILYRSSTLGYHDMGFDHNIQPWAWRYLKRHPEDLKSGAEMSRRGKGT